MATVNLRELIYQCHDKATAVAFLQKYGILPIQKQCTNGHDMNLHLSKKNDRWRCKIRECREDHGLRKGTWLENSRIDFDVVVFFIYSWSQNMATIKFCERELGMSHCTTVDWCNYLREVCAWTLLNNPIKIGGPGLTVEIDESLFSRRKSHAGRVLPCQWVFGGICRETGECFLYAVPNRSATTLMKVISESILPGTTIISDCWKAYTNVSSSGDYQHLTVNHQYNFVDPETGAHTQTIESTWRNAKMKNKANYGTHRTMLDSYLCEFLWRKRLGDRDPFEAIMNDVKGFWSSN